jgi:hypothetical protein
MWVSGQRHAPAFLPREREPVPILQELGWAPGPVWKDEENLVPQWDSTPDRPAHSQSLYRLRYPGPHETMGESGYLHVTITGIYSCSDWLWGSVSLLINGYWRSFRGISRWRLKSTTHSHLVRGLRINGANLLLPLHIFMACTAITFPFLPLIYTQKLYQFEFVAGQLHPTLKQNPGDHKLNGEHKLMERCK